MQNIYKINNYLPNQYDYEKKFNVNHNYLTEQFSDHELILEKIKKVVLNNDFTLGKEVDYLEEDFANLIGVKYAIGVGSGTDALFLSLKSIGIKEGDEVITTPFTFYATIGAIVTAGAKPVFADICDDYNINASEIEKKINSKTKAILPVHWSGKPCDMDAIRDIANKYNLTIVEDACHAILAKYKNKNAGNLGDIGCFSFHPLKNLNVWGDGGIITTNDPSINHNLRLIRNHGLSGRNTCEIFAYNSRLDTIQAVVARHMLNKIEFITEKRIYNAHYLDKGLKNISELKLPNREKHLTEVFHLYMFECERRNELKSFLNQNNIDAKIHYPVPMHLQPAAKSYGYKKGDFPKSENLCLRVISLPVHEFITKENLDYMINKIQEFYR